MPPETIGPSCTLHAAMVAAEAGAMGVKATTNAAATAKTASRHSHGLIALFKSGCRSSIPAPIH
ncbi:hypothetical protein [Aurantimonas sp. VKM B-3413]|uniref:hypothetical protein n=1 Tax=Aurantimonas sp. VKM B-3413 TaxID=2779401 RepID=UPI001E5D8D85|nr:hypothetical protein [Aurantimonas sp. VKM B-3413]MCB8840260.1 hypothetical protein [Aurantimonas sp. VKM B-3413]